ncbi:ABC transporter ATP-binding protein [Lederbergia lenta]|uniref:ABC transporter ATP-binding protein n=1 Tax=Lederbergia lenta TaxID=1467 RepID=UPI000DBE902E|nr:ABC transporter ATP-binding protein [Lederbergia lenta]MCM3112321.1 ABC transporter ATP-binding protein [Lederbergia lenta]MEC2326541.1 ABC transporter ATP-binding protein [Lederbergia lenta]
MGTLEINGLTKSFEGREVLKEIDLEMKEGEFLTILGPSGSGKSTLFHLIGGLLHPDQGTIMLDGENITGKRGLISYMPQQPALFPWRTVLQNVLLGQELQGKVEREKALNMIKRAGLEGYEQSLPDALSGGMKQRVAFIRALLSPQSLICLDEPFSALDDFTRLEMHQWLLSIWAEYKKTILFVTHNIDEALFLSDRIIVLSSNPATIISEFEIPFERPRSESLLLSEEFLEWKRKLSQSILQRGTAHE